MWLNHGFGALSCHALNILLFHWLYKLFRTRAWEPWIPSTLNVWFFHGVLKRAIFITISHISRSKEVQWVWFLCYSPNYNLRKRLIPHITMFWKCYFLTFIRGPFKTLGVGGQPLYLTNQCQIFRVSYVAIVEPENPCI